MTRKLFPVLFYLFGTLFSNTAVSQEKSKDQAATIVDAVKRCVDEVHKQDDGYYKRFDAYYNSATGAVENNVTTVGEQGALYIFRKCMASQGLPLK